MVYFRFPFRKTAFWIIFVTLMLPVEVRIYPTYKVVADLKMLDTYAGLIMPLMMFVGNINYVVIAVVGGLRVAHGTLSLGEVQAFIQYTRQFTQPLTTVASMANLLQSGVASAGRVFELLDAPEQDADATGAPAVEGAA